MYTKSGRGITRYAEQGKPIDQRKFSRIKVAEKLITNRKPYAIPNDETYSTIKRLRKMREEFNNLER